MSNVIVLGTGATSGTLGKLGGVVGFTDRLDEVHRNWRGDYPELARVVEDCGHRARQLDAIWTQLDYRSKLRDITGSEYGPRAAIQLRRSVLEAYSFSDEIRALVRARTGGVLVRVLSALAVGDTLASFNWDTLAETIAIDMLGKDLVQGPSASPKREIQLLKPHGSLSWVHSSDGTSSQVVIRDGRRPRLQPLAAASVQAEHGFYQPLLLGAVPMKSELLPQLQSGQPELYDTVTKQWIALGSAIAAAARITFVGYGFPSEDSHGRFLLREAARGRTRVVTFYTRSQDRLCIQRALADTFGSEQQCDYAGEVDADGAA